MPDIDPAILDHLAIGVRRWSDAYDRFVHDLGGTWAYGGPSGDFSPYQLSFGLGMKLEFISPHAPDGFMQSFMERHGPSPHHVTFKVKSLDATIGELHRHGFDSFGGRPDLDVYREAFVHPKLSGIGTLLQITETDTEFIERAARLAGAPDGFPVPGREASEVALFGLTAPDLARARDLLEQVLGGTVQEEGAGWFFITWRPGQSIIVRAPTAAPGTGRLWGEAPAEGVAFVLFGPPDLTPAYLEQIADRLTKLPHQQQTGIPVWLA